LEANFHYFQETLFHGLPLTVGSVRKCKNIDLIIEKFTDLSLAKKVRENQPEQELSMSRQE
jgi:hypothetical protein